MSAKPEFNVDDFLVDRGDPTTMPQFLVCMDDRPLKKAFLYWQLGGGADGFGRDEAVGMEVNHKNSFINKNVPVHWMGSLARRGLYGRGTSAFMHERCAAYLSALPVTDTIIDQAEKVFTKALAFDPELTEVRFEKVKAANERLRQASGLLVPSSESDPDLLGGVPMESLPSVPRLELIDAEHEAGDIVVDYKADALWNPFHAWRAKKPAYYIGRGIFRLAHSKLSSFKDTPFEAVGDASTVRHAAISLHLPVPPGQEQLNIHLREEAA